MMEQAGRAAKRSGASEGGSRLEGRLRPYPDVGYDIGLQAAAHADMYECSHVMLNKLSGTLYLNRIPLHCQDVGIGEKVRMLTLRPEAQL